MQFVFNLYRQRPIACLFGVFVVLPLAVSAYFGYQYLHSTAPKNHGVLQVSGVNFPVSIERNRQGVTKIVGQDDNDVFFAMGFAHAQDRLWQLELHKRMTAGTLAEIFGKSAVNFDLYVRTLAINESAERSWHSLSAEAQSSLQAYAAGINHWLSLGHELPLEFSILDVEPGQWRPTDSLAWVKMFSLNLSGNFQQDLNRLIALRTLGREKARSLIPGVNEQKVVTIPRLTPSQLGHYSNLSQFGQQIENQWGVGGKNIGSNAWVVSGSHSKNGIATLANDPHLGLELPSQWYAVDLQGAELNVAGMSLVGLPIVMLGKNAHIGWGATNMMADTMDLYFETINSENPEQYKRGDYWVDFESRIETIQVKADFPAFLREPLAPLKVKIRNTDLGPIISDLIGDFDQPLSLRWTGSGANDTSFDAFFQLNYAADWNSFKLAMKKHISPAMNLFYLDAEQNIGYLGAGRIPIRGRGHGNLPIAGDSLADAWQGYIPFNEMPQSYNPEQGFLLSANNRVVDNNYPYFISYDWADPERAERIQQLILHKLSQGQNLTLADHKDFQQDLLDLQAVNILPLLLSVESNDPLVKAMLEHLRQWDGTTSETSVSTTLFFTWIRHLRTQLYADEFDSYWNQQSLTQRQNRIVAEVPIPVIQSTLLDETIDWCDDKTTDIIEDCNSIKLSALYATYEELAKLLGSDFDDWTWGQAHSVIYKHRPFSYVKGLDLLFERKFARGGSPNSINMSVFDFDIENGYVQTVGPAFRQILQFSAQGSDHLYVNSTGQSGNIIDEHYDDMMEPFVDGMYFSFSSSAPASDKLLLVPGDALSRGSSL